MYTMKSHFYHKKSWKESIPNANIPEVRRMLLVGHGTLCLIDGEIVPFNKRCKNIYRCETSFVSKKLEWYIEIYDKDLKIPDLIGKGKCKSDSECKLGRAKIKITN